MPTFERAKVISQNRSYQDACPNKIVDQRPWIVEFAARRDLRHDILPRPSSFPERGPVTGIDRQRKLTNLGFVFCGFEVIAAFIATVECYQFDSHLRAAPDSAE